MKPCPGQHCAPALISVQQPEQLCQCSVSFEQSPRLMCALQELKANDKASSKTVERLEGKAAALNKRITSLEVTLFTSRIVLHNCAGFLQLMHLCL